MKVFFIILFLLSVNSVLGQEIPRASLVDEFGRACSEDLMARMDNFFIQLNNNPDAQGFILFYGASDAEGRNLKFVNYMTRFYPIRRFDGSRLTTVRGESRAEQLVQFWIVPRGATPPKPEKPFIPDRYTRTTLFDRSWIGFQRWSGGLEIYDDGFFDLGCNFSPNERAFANILKANSNLHAYLMIYTETDKKSVYGLRLASFALNQFVKEYRVERSRVRAVYGGKRKKAEIEFWFVPKGEQSPPRTSDLHLD